VNGVNNDGPLLLPDRTTPAQRTFILHPLEIERPIVQGRSEHALSIYFMHNNFLRIHQTLRCTPAMQAVVTDRLWDMADIVQVVEEWEANQKVAQ
jgi:hypothetical protein